MAKRPPIYGVPKAPPGLGQNILNSIEDWRDNYWNPGYGQGLGGAPKTQNNNQNSGSSGAYNNPYYDQLASMYRAQGAAEAAGMRDSIRQMLIGMGMVPGGFKDKFGALDDATRALIQKNTDTGISTYARLLEQKKMGVTDLINRLNSKGLRRSGAKGFGLRKNQLAYDRNQSDVLSQLMQSIGGMYSGYTQNEYARQAALIQAAMNYQSGSYGSTQGSTGYTWRPNSSGFYSMSDSSRFRDLYPGSGTDESGNYAQHGTAGGGGFYTQ